MVMGSRSYKAKYGLFEHSLSFLEDKTRMGMFISYIVKI